MQSLYVLFPSCTAPNGLRRALSILGGDLNLEMRPLRWTVPTHLHSTLCIGPSGPAGIESGELESPRPPICFHSGYMAPNEGSDASSSITWDETEVETIVPCRKVKAELKRALDNLEARLSEKMTTIKKKEGIAAANNSYSGSVIYLLDSVMCSL